MHLHDKILFIKLYDSIFFLLKFFELFLHERNRTYEQIMNSWNERDYHYLFVLEAIFYSWDNRRAMNLLEVDRRKLRRQKNKNKQCWQLKEGRQCVSKKDFLALKLHREERMLLKGAQSCDASNTKRNIIK